MPRRNGVDAFVGRAVGTSAEQQECLNILLIQFRGADSINQRLQTARPEHASRLHAVIKRTHTGIVAGQDDGAVNRIVYDKTPIPDQLDKTVGSPALVGS